MGTNKLFKEWKKNLHNQATAHASKKREEKLNNAQMPLLMPIAVVAK
jgi:hypothetical protein